MAILVGVPNASDLTTEVGSFLANSPLSRFAILLFASSKSVVLVCCVDPFPAGLVTRLVIDSTKDVMAFSMSDPDCIGVLYPS